MRVIVRKQQYPLDNLNVWQSFAIIGLLSPNDPHWFGIIGVPKAGSELMGVRNKEKIARYGNIKYETIRIKKTQIIFI